MIKIERDKLIRAVATVRTGLNAYALTLRGAIDVIYNWEEVEGMPGLFNITNELGSAALEAQCASRGVDDALKLLNELDN